MLLEEFVVLLGLKADTKEAKEFSTALDRVETSAENVDNAMVGAFKSTENFVNVIGAVMGVVGFFTGIVAGLSAAFHGTIMELDDLIKEDKLLTKVTKDQIDQQKKYKDSVETLGKRFQSLKVEMAFNFLPTMQRMVDSFDNFLASNKDLIVNGIMKFLNIMTGAIQVITNFIRSVDKVISSTLGWEATLYVVAAALLWVNRAMLLAFATNPIFWVIAVFGVLLLLIDDFMTYLDGGESQFGEFWGSMLKWIDKISPSLQKVWDMLILGMSYLIEFGAFVARYLGGAITDFSVLFVAIWNFILGIFTGNTDLMKEAFSVFVDALLSMFSNLASLFEPIAQLLVSIMSSVWDSIVNTVKARIDLIIGAIKAGISNMTAALSSVYDIITAPFARAFDWISDKFSGIGSLISGAINGVSSLASRGASMATTNNSNSSVVNVNAPISVTSSDPNKAGVAVQKSLTPQMNRAKQNQGSGNRI